MNKKCIVCGIIFYKKKLRSYKYFVEKQKCCSMKCSGKYRALHYKPSEAQKLAISRANRRYKGGKLSTCKLCKKVFRAIDGSYFCSRACWKIYILLCPNEYKKEHPQEWWKTNPEARKKASERQTKFNKQRTGKKHHFWQGGISYEEYGRDFTNGLKEQARFRDGYKCKVCGCPQIEVGKGLDVHHIDYNKKHNELSNLVALCPSCHSKTNGKRGYWKKFFTIPQEMKIQQA